MRRRRFLQLGTAAAAVLGASACGMQGSTGSHLGSAVPLPERFRAPLPIPPYVDPDANGAVTLTARTGQVEIFPGHPTLVHGYDGGFPGPTVRATRDQQLTLTLANELDQPTVLHLHGGKTPPESDGFPTDFVEPGQSRAYVFPMQQRAATLWYHDHTMDATGANVYHGLAGMLLIHDPAEDALGLPDGDRDIPLMICDRAFDADHQLHYPQAPAHPAAQSQSAGQGHDGHGGHGSHGPAHGGSGAGASGHGPADPAYLGGVLGDVMLVNGAPWPVLEVDAVRYRFRLLNASNARRLELSLSEGAMTQIGSDLGLLAEPVQRDTATLAQAERIDVVIDFSAYAVGSKVRLRNLLGDDAMADVMEFHVVRKAADESTVPDKLSDYPVPGLGEVSIVRDLHFALGAATAQHPNGVWTVNGEIFDPDKPILTVQRGTVERWRLSTDVHHPVHVHLLQMHVHQHRGLPPGPAYAGAKDTIDLHPGDTCEVLLPIEGYPGKYVLHCHNLEHEDMMMMARFDVV